MTKDNAIVWILLGLLVVLGSACDGTNKVEQRRLHIEEKAKERIAYFVQSRAKNCYQQRLAIAAKNADSILIAEAIAIKDSLSQFKPTRPDKPLTPQEKKAPDSLAVSPFFIDSTLIFKRDSLLLDSLHRDSLLRLD